MSNQLHGRLWLSVAALLLFTFGVSARERTSGDCRVREARIAFFLGCCGDRVAHYPGPPFPATMSESERATKALQEIGAAMRSRCYDVRSGRGMTLVLNRIGAHIMRAQAVRVLSGGSMRSAIADIDAAAAELATFVRLNPVAASQVWHWVASAFRLCGRSWESLAFVAQLPEACCNLGEIHSLEGDLLFELGAHEAAAKRYSKWLGEVDPSGLCGHERSIFYAAQLRRRGFKIPAAEVENPDRCVVESDWQPYVQFLEE